MNKGQKVIAVLLGAAVAELAVLDYAVVEYLRHGIEVEVDLNELEAAGEVALDDIARDGEVVLNETEEGE